jgi:hypothetical protein
VDLRGRCYAAKYPETSILTTAFRVAGDQVGGSRLVEPRTTFSGRNAHADGLGARGRLFGNVRRQPVVEKAKLRYEPLLVEPTRLAAHIGDVVDDPPVDFEMWSLAASVVADQSNFVSTKVLPGQLEHAVEFGDDHGGRLALRVQIEHAVFMRVAD